MLNKTLEELKDLIEELEQEEDHQDYLDSREYNSPILVKINDIDYLTAEYRIKLLVEAIKGKMKDYLTKNE